MAFDPHLAERLRKALKSAPAIVEQKMMGGLCFMSAGHMACGIHEHFLIVRVGAAAYSDVLNEPHVRPMQVGRMKPGGFVFVEPKGCETDAALKRWIKRGLAFAATLPPKKSSEPESTVSARTSRQSKRHTADAKGHKRI